MQFERNPFDEITQIVCTTYLVRIWWRSRTADSDCPPMCVLWWSCSFALLRGQNYSGISIDNWSMYCSSLERYNTMSKGENKREFGDFLRTLTRTRSLAMITVEKRPRLSEWQTPQLPVNQSQQRPTPNSTLSPDHHRNHVAPQPSLWQCVFTVFIMIKTKETPCSPQQHHPETKNVSGRKSASFYAVFF